MQRILRIGNCFNSQGREQDQTNSSGLRYHIIPDWQETSGRVETHHKTLI
jgi:hypothetical protein